jgi:hypothetical protein
MTETADNFIAEVLAMLRAIGNEMLLCLPVRKADIVEEEPAVKERRL